MAFWGSVQYGHALNCLHVATKDVGIGPTGSSNELNGAHISKQTALGLLVRPQSRILMCVASVWHSAQSGAKASGSDDDDLDIT